MKKSPSLKKNSAPLVRETSAGGLVARQDKVLLIKVKNLLGRVVWTFPKGHLEPGETAEAAALREVKEETGWDCKITRRLVTVEYFFMREGNLVKKNVFWYLMEPLLKTGAPDAEEVMECRWMPLDEAESYLSYKSDKTLMESLRAGEEKPAKPRSARGRRRP